MRNIHARGAKAVKLCALLDKQSERRVMLTPDYFGVLVESSFMMGYGLGAPDVGRNLPYIAVAK
jgi:hypoxanthine phosphoribosyltransferase